MNKILIIEDDEAIAEIEKDYLENCGYEADIVYDGETGLKIGLDGNYSLILLDLMLPKMDGFTVCRRLREKLDIPILMVTARQEDIDKIKGLGLGADDYIEKPFSPAVLVARVKANLAQYERIIKKRKNSSVITLGSISLNTGTHRVYVDEKEIELKNKEYELLKLLMSNAEIVTARDTIMERIWGIDFEGESRTLDMHIKTLRKKLGEAGSMIKTVRNVGYIMSDKEN